MNQFLDGIVLVNFFPLELESDLVTSIRHHTIQLLFYQDKYVDQCNTCIKLCKRIIVYTLYIRRDSDSTMKKQY